MVIFRAFYVSRSVRQGVLVARFLGHPRIQILQRFLLQRVINVATRAVRVFGKPLESAIVERATHTYGKHRDAVSQHFLNGVVVRVGVVILSPVNPIADDKYDFSPVSWPVLQELCSTVDSIIQRLRGRRKNLSRGTGNRGRSVDGVAVDAGPIEGPAWSPTPG